MVLGLSRHLREPDPAVYLMATPMTHAAGALALATIADGGAVVTTDGVHLPQLYDALDEHRVTRTFLPPTAIYKLLADPDLRRAAFATMRHLVYAGAPISPERLAEALETIGPVMTQIFGQSEAPMICTFLGPDEHLEALADPAKRDRLASCGRASAVAAVEVMDDDGRIVPPGETGEIVVAGDLVMEGYLDDPDATAEARRPGGWHGTGDVGRKDEDGYLYIVDRKRDVIVSGGFNVFPLEVERVIQAHPAVLDCAVVGAPDDRWGERVTAFVEVAAGRVVQEDELIGWCKDALGSVKTPKSVWFAPLPRSENGKVLRRVVRDRLWATRERQV